MGLLYVGIGIQLCQFFRSGGTMPCTLSEGKLHLKTNRLGHYLQRRRVGDNLPGACRSPRAKFKEHCCGSVNTTAITYMLPSLHLGAAIVYCTDIHVLALRNIMRSLIFLPFLTQGRRFQHQRLSSEPTLATVFVETPVLIIRPSPLS